MTRRPTFALLAAAVLVALPLGGDAGITPPAVTTAACFSNAGRAPPPDATGDEPFFRLPTGTPNVMVLLDTSGSMLDFPVDLAYPSTTTTGWPASHGTCSVPSLDAVTARITATPFDNGYTTPLVTDDPPWGLTRCQVTMPLAPTVDETYDPCLFRKDSYFKAYQQSTVGLETTRALSYNANPCAAVTSASGGIVRDYTAAGVWGPALADNLAECQTCLATKGYYLFYVNYMDSGLVSRNTGVQAVFRGDFLNAFPPKYVAARKVVKDLVRLDPTSPLPTDNIRFGLTRFNPNAGSATGTASSMRANDGGVLVVPLGPNCQQSFPITDVAYGAVRQTIVDAVNDPAHIAFAGNTPLAETLFNIGQYFSNTGASSLYTTFFGTAWNKTSFAETAAGSMNAAWAQPGLDQRSFCFACQNSSVVVVTDGAPTADNNLPKSPTPGSNHSTFNNDFRRWTNATVDCPACTAGDALHKVAYFMSQTDLRPDLLNGSRPQNVYTYTISFGISQASDPQAIALLQKTALLGNGLFANTSNADDLRNALNTAVADVIDHQISFSSTNANALQVSKTVSADAYLGRFRPSSQTMWEGHLFAGQVFDEFGQGCDSRFATSAQTLISCGTRSGINPNLNGDASVDGKALCDAAYVVDQDCDPIVEDASGTFLKGQFDPSTHQLLSTPDPAAMWWDAGKVLSVPTEPGYRSADETAPNARAIYTTLDLDGDARFTSADTDPTHAPNGLLPFTVDNAEALAPFLGIDLAYCQNLLQRIGACDSDATTPIPACPAVYTPAVAAQCASQIIYFIRGYDVLDWDGDYCAGPGNPRNTTPYGSCASAAACAPGATCTAGKCVPGCTAAGEQRDRTADSRAANSRSFWKLGDVFHSSPVLVKAPVPKEICRYGLENQCVLTLFGSSRTADPTPLKNDYSLTDCKGSTREVDAYDRWRYDQRDRRQVVLVGANDGMLHAFDAGTADLGKPADFYCSHPPDSGTGTELWAYIPPDQLPRLKKALDNHTYFVDGNTMVREVWIDANNDGVKQATEYHTVAISTERGGGIHYTALDITDPAVPKFMWQFPGNNSADAQLMGQSWTDFLPRAPPVGPVRLEVPTGGPNDPTGRGYEERWVVMVNGGYDPTLVRGRAVFMLDVATGRKIWQYTDADFKAMRGNADATMLPVAASIAMVDIGAADQPTGQVDIDAFFDTATWGDLGGNLFVARFHEPGKIDVGTGLVTNWTASRAFETNRQSGDLMTASQRGAFFYMTANALDGPSRLMTFLGTGNREKLLLEKPTCGPDNVLGCCQAGCNVTASTATTSYGAGSCSTSGFFTCSGGSLAFTRSESGACSGPFACGPTFDSQVTLDFDCGAAGDPAPMTAQLTCDAAGVCSVDQPFSPTAEFSVASLTPTTPQEHFYGIWSYGREPSRRFDDAASARAFDGNRFTDVSFSGCADVPGSSCKLVDVTKARKARQVPGGPLITICPTGITKCEANSDDPGFMYLYGLKCPDASCATPTWTDERTGAAGAVSQSCLQWSSFRPTGATGGTDPCTATTGTPTSFAYFSDYVTGVPRISCGFADDPTNVSEVYRARVHNAFAPPQNPSPRVVVNERGQVSYGTLRIESGQAAEKTTSGVRSSVGEYIYRLEVDRSLHTCRHVDPTTCE
jgi:type IV pilus assembly protein PilY1